MHDMSGRSRLSSMVCIDDVVHLEYEKSDRWVQVPVAILSAIFCTVSSLFRFSSEALFKEHDVALI